MSSLQKPTCCFCGKDDIPLSQIPNETTKWTFQFPVYGCTECMENENKMNLLKEISELHSLENLYVSIHFNCHFFVNPSDVYIPFLGLSGNLRFLCVNKRCSLKVRSSDPSDGGDCLVNESSILGCVIDPQSGQITTESVSIVRIIRGAHMLNRILELNTEHPYVKMLVEFESTYPDLRIDDAIQQSPSESYVGPRIDDFSIADPNSILKLFSLLVSGIYSDRAIKAILSGEMKEVFLKFITDSMISMTAFMRQNGFQEKIPELKEASVIPDFLTKNYGRAGFSFNYQNIICQNFRNLLKLFRKILRRLYEIDGSHRAIDLFQYCRFLYASLHVSNRDINRRLIPHIPFEKCRPYSKFLERYVMLASPFCVEIFANVPASETELDKCVICQSDNSANVIGKCPEHNICCLDCFQGDVQKLEVCPSCRSPNFLP
jgi:hypothetical protein